MVPVIPQASVAKVQNAHRRRRSASAEAPSAAGIWAMLQAAWAAAARYVDQPRCS